MTADLNRLWNLKNYNQGQQKRVLALCSAGLLRSPTVAWVLSNEPYNYNTRAAGVTPAYALIKVDEYLFEWADEILCVSNEVWEEFKRWADDHKLDLSGKRLPVLNIQDIYMRRAPQLVKIIEEQYAEYLIKQP